MSVDVVAIFMSNFPSGVRMKRSERYGSATVRSEEYYQVIIARRCSHHLVTMLTVHAQR